MTCHIYSSWSSSSVPWATIGCDQNTTWTTQHKTTQSLESVLNASTDKRRLVLNRSRHWNCLSHQWCTPFNMNWQTNGNLCCIYPLLQFFFSNTIAFWPWVKAWANKWLPPHKNEPSVCVPAPVIKVAAVAAPLFSFLGWQWLSRYLVALLAATLRAGECRQCMASCKLLTSVSPGTCRW